MNQAPVSYYPQMVIPQPNQPQLSYNAVKIDVHNPKVMDGQPTYPSAYGMPYNPYYAYPQASGMPYYPAHNVMYPQQPVYTMPQQPCLQPFVTTPQLQPQIQQPVVTAPIQMQPQIQQPVVTAPIQVQPQIQQPVAPAPIQVQPQVQQPVAPAPIQVQPQVQQPVVPTPIQVQPQVQQPVVPTPIPVQQQPQQNGVAPAPIPVPVVPAPVQQVINNGIPATQVINQNPSPQAEQQIINPAATTYAQPAPNVETPKPEVSMPSYDITPVLRGLQSNNMAEQEAALNKIGEAGDNPEVLKNYLETSVLDSLLGILHSDTSKLEGPTKEQEAARNKWMKEKDLPEKDQTLTPQEKQLAMTLAPKEVAEKNKQLAMYSISIIQKALADEIEKKSGEKISIEKLPAIDHIVDVLKTNPSPLLRASAIVALAHLNKDEYKPILNDIFKLAQKDQDPNVQQVATEALERINNPSAAN